MENSSLTVTPDSARSMEIWLADLPATPGHVQHGRRPVVIVSNDANNANSPIVTIVPLTSNRKKLTQPTHICLLRRVGEASRWFERLAIRHAPAVQLGIELQVNLAA